MRNVLKFFVFLLSVFAMHAQASAALDAECSSTWALDSVTSPYGNIYHEGVDARRISWALETCYYRDYYSKFTDEHSDYPPGTERKPYVYGHVRKVFPVYSRTSNRPILSQTVIFRNGEYSQMVSSTAEVYTAKHIADCGRSRLSDNWFDPNCGMWNHPARGDERKNLVLLADTEPYATAPTIQFYSYHNKLLMVARDGKGEVYRFAYEDSMHRISSKTVKEFLGDKWFRP